MPKYRIFAGLGGGFGGAQEVAVENHANMDIAMSVAYLYAIEEYDSYGGMHGLFNDEDALEEDPTLSEEDLEIMRNEDMETWLDYYVEEIIDEEIET